MSTLHVANHRFRSLEDFFVHFKIPFDKDKYTNNRVIILERFKKMLTEANYSIDQDYEQSRQIFQSACRIDSSVLCIELEGCGKCCTEH